MNGLQRFWRYSRALITGRLDSVGSPLQTAAFNGDIKKINALLNVGADINAGDTPPLHLAITRGRANVVRLLLERGARTDLPGLRELLVSPVVKMGRNRQEIMDMLADAGVERDPHKDRNL